MGKVLNCAIASPASGLGFCLGFLDRIQHLAAPPENLDNLGKPVFDSFVFVPESGQSAPFPNGDVQGRLSFVVDERRVRSVLEQVA